MNKLKAGDTIYTIVKNVSRTSNTRDIVPLIIDEDGTIKNISYEVAETLGWKVNKAGDGVVVKGYGMDMTYHLVHQLGIALFPDGYIGNENTKARGGLAIGERDLNGGYALNRVLL